MKIKELAISYVFIWTPIEILERGCPKDNLAQKLMSDPDTRPNMKETQQTFFLKLLKDKKAIVSSLVKVFKSLREDRIQHKQKLLYKRQP